VKLSESAGTKVRGIYKWHLSEKSRKANAALTGLGPTRRIILADTLLDHYSSDESSGAGARTRPSRTQAHPEEYLRAGRDHAIRFLGGHFVLHLAIEQWGMFERLADFANLPCWSCFHESVLLADAGVNAYSRYNERQADRYAFRSIKSVQPFISSMNKLAAQNSPSGHPRNGWSGSSTHTRLFPGESPREAWQPANCDGCPQVRPGDFRVVSLKLCHRLLRISSTRCRSSPYRPRPCHGASRPRE